ncbi:hypothetical protein C0580_01175 [Candidatus Parcubacteria bacterium]|nr:MAG: hypothetical protein C0580_01175 [Candidatus Parcubacteria bacterium]
MKLAILFWFYKEPDICLNRLELIKKYNPQTKIFGLYGGDKKQVSIYKKKLGKYLDDFYLSPLHNKPKNWKWIHGDLMILEWYKSRGKKLKSWDSVIVIQWDALVLGNIKKQFPGLKKDQVFISGTRILDKTIEPRWHWTNPKHKERKNYLAYKKYIAENYNYTKKLFCSLFILQVFPRKFFDKWLTVKDNIVGMLEYKIPTYAEIFKIPFYKRDVGVWWFRKKDELGMVPLNARCVEIEDKYIKKELKKKKGFRIFHPYFNKWVE